MAKHRGGKGGKKVDDVVPDTPTPRKGIPSYKAGAINCSGHPQCQHGALEKYDKRGKHQGEYDPETGGQNKGPDSTRSVDP